MDEMIGKTVVVDTDTQYVYVGDLLSISEDCVVIETVDVHDRTDVDITKERYILDSRRHGVKANRKKVYIMRRRVVSMSLLDDILKF